MPAGKERIAQIVEYALSHSDTEACESYHISTETLSRYHRVYKQHFGEYGELLMQIRQRYSPEELAVIAKGQAQHKYVGKELSFDGDIITFGYMTDTHIGSKDTHEDYITSALKEFEAQSCQFFVHSGDVTEGMSGRDGHVYELSHIGYKAQRDAAIALFSSWKKPSYWIAGNHDAWYMKKADMGGDIVEDICKQLPNAIYLGYGEGDIPVNGITMKLWHGEDGSSYATSYRMQKIVEGFSGGEKPSVLLLGHTHKEGYFFERNVHMVGGGCIQCQTDFMRYKRLTAHVGFWIIKMCVRDHSVIWLEPRWYPIY